MHIFPDGNQIYDPGKVRHGEYDNYAVTTWGLQHTKYLHQEWFVLYNNKESLTPDLDWGDWGNTDGIKLQGFVTRDDSMMYCLF